MPSNLSLHEIPQILTKSFGFFKYEYDYENIFEWFEAKDAEGFLWSVSPKHDGDGQPSFEDYLIIRRELVPSDTDETGQKLANLFSCPLRYGEGMYDKSDIWIFKEQECFTPNV